MSDKKAWATLVLRILEFIGIAAFVIFIIMQIVR